MNKRLLLLGLHATAMFGLGWMARWIYSMGQIDALDRRDGVGQAAREGGLLEMMDR